MKREDFHKALEEAGHELIRDEEGNVDIWQLDYEPHNGPACKKCDKSWCHHCENTITPCTGSK